jgi:hypothetical protein
MAQLSHLHHDEQAFCGCDTNFEIIFPNNVAWNDLGLPSLVSLALNLLSTNPLTHVHKLLQFGFVLMELMLVAHSWKCNAIFGKQHANSLIK